MRSEMPTRFRRAQGVAALSLTALVSAWVIVSPAAATATAQSSSGEDAITAIPFTEAQVARGQALFRKNCMFCHSSNNGNRASRDEPLRGILVGAGLPRSVLHLGGGRPLQYPTVYHLFARIRGAMPAWDIESISPAQKLDIVAYLLREAGLPPGPAELTLDVAALKRMRLSDPPSAPEEPGFAPVFNGRDFTGIKFLFGTNCTPAPDDCGKTEPTSFRIEHGTIVGHGREHGYFYTERRYLDFTLRFDFMWVPPADADPEDQSFSEASGGILLFITDAENQIWPKSIEIEGDNDNLMAAIGVAARIEATTDRAAVALANKGPNRWNAVEIVSQDGEVTTSLNGARVSHVREHPFTEPGSIAFQYQGGTIAYRNLRIKEE